MWINWLLKYDGYPPGVVVALLLHGLLMWIFLPKEFEPADQIRIEPASYVVASAVAQSPQKLRRIEQVNTQRRNEEAARERQRQAEAQRQRQAEADRQRQAEAQRQQAEAARQRQAEAERQRVAEENRKREAEQERQRQAEAERQRQADAERQRQETAQREAAARAAAEAAAQQMSAENQMVSQYMALIRDLVSGAWSRPPSARNEMVAVVQLRLTPTGEIVDRAIVRPSGDAAFDRSVLQAVDRVGSFPELQEMPTAIFERNFRTFQLEFSPEDLLR